METQTRVDATRFRRKRVPYCVSLVSTSDQASEEERSPVQHRIRWWVYAWNNDGIVHKIPRAKSMRGTWSYDATCTCGWETSTGGAVRRFIEKEVRKHKSETGTLN